MKSAGAERGGVVSFGPEVGDKGGTPSEEKKGTPPGGGLGGGGGWVEVHEGGISVLEERGGAGGLEGEGEGEGRGGRGGERGGGRGAGEDKPSEEAMKGAKILLDLFWAEKDSAADPATMSASPPPESDEIDKDPSGRDASSKEEGQGPEKSRQQKLPPPPKPLAASDYFLFLDRFELAPGQTAPMIKDTV